MEYILASPTELAHLLDVTTERIRQWREKGCPYRLVNGRTVYHVAAVIAWRQYCYGERGYCELPEAWLENLGRLATVETALQDITAAMSEKQTLPAFKQRIGKALAPLGFGS